LLACYDIPNRSKQKNQAKKERVKASDFINEFGSRKEIKQGWAKENQKTEEQALGKSGSLPYYHGHRPQGIKRE
jgi:hypothetical protein